MSTVVADVIGKTNLCQHCGKRTKYTENGYVHPYCGKTCARADRPAHKYPSPTSNPARTQPKLSATPGIPNFPVTNHSTDTGNTFGSTNPRNYGPTPPVKTTNTSTSTTNPSQTTTPGNDTNPLSLAASTDIKPGCTNHLRWTTLDRTCRTPGCVFPVCVQNGVTSRYCSHAHEELGKRGCIYCRRALPEGVFPFCPTCSGGVLLLTPIIIEVPKDHEEYKGVNLQFQEAWLHNKRCPEVRAIYKIVSTNESVARYEQYLDKVEIARKFASQGESRGNEGDRWHGTTRKCAIGDKGVTEFCSDISCSLCCIMKTSFDLKFFGKKTKFGRFGAGIYTSATSSKSDSYSRNDFTSKWKAVLLNKVVIGRGYSLKVDDTTLTGPPAGYDSVIGEVGVKLNYDELVVYDNDAIRPSYLVMYDTPK